ncbi:MAG: metallophosphoesterase family protein [Acidobacteriota bacterium]
MRRFGILSDTHGLLRPQVLEMLQGCEKILHAGDVGKASILEALGHIAPVIAVRGNVDEGGELSALPATVEGDLDGVPFAMTHRREDAPASWRRGAELVIFGHSHRPEMDWFGKCLYLNPGAAGPRRFSLPLSLALIHVAPDRRWFPEILAIRA